ncbi:ATP-dependent DNA helicase [Frankliniella fusca]|uniref:ATP-dependent DNA helicase n=1 Tax=Frankliniella fusca TaxID=407009 RepID=A0AAE1I0I1_9NEOP|nr:ATP-dependent DNA helicase [Frankliniella fusca]
MPEEEKSKARKLLSQIKSDSENIARTNEDCSFQEYLTLLNMEEQTYITAIRSNLKRPTVFLKRNLNERRVNAYNKEMLILWEAHMDMQFVVSPYGCIKYVVSYISKAQKGMSKLLKEVADKVSKGDEPTIKKLRKIVNAFLNNCEISAQEIALHVLQIPMSKSSIGNVYINTCPPEERVFLKKDESANDNCKDKVIYELQNKSGYLTMRSKRLVIQFRNYKENQDKLNFQRENIMLFTNWRTEPFLLDPNLDQNFNENLDKIKQNRNVYCKYDTTFNNISVDLMEEDNQDNEEDEYVPSEFKILDLNDTPSDFDLEIPNQSESNVQIQSTRFPLPNLIPETEFLALINSLNEKQRKYLLNLANLVKTNPSEQFFHFISGGAGVGKSTLINAIKQVLERFWMHQPNSKPEDIRILPVAPTGKAATGINGTTIDSAFGLGFNVKDKLRIGRVLNSDKRNTLACILSKLKLIILDEISMCNFYKFQAMNSVLQEIFENYKPFGVPDGISNGSPCVLKAVIMGTLLQRGENTGQKIPIRAYVQFPNPATGQKRRDRLRDIIRKDGIKDHTWTPIERISRSFTITASSQIQVTRNQLPILPSNAQTIHSSQSCTYQKIIVFVSGLSRKLLYTAISRVTSLQGLYIAGTYTKPNEATLENDPSLKEMCRMRLDSPLQLMLTFPEDVKSSTNTMIIFQNVRSLHLHFTNVSNDRSFLSCDMIMLAETWSLPEDKYDINNYTIIFRTDCKLVKRKAFGTIIYVNNNILPYCRIIFQNETVNTEKHHSTVVAIQLHHSCIMMVYKSPKAPWSLLQQQMEHALQVCYNEKISEISIMGDFNIKYQQSEPSYNLLYSFMQTKSLFMLLDPTKISTGHNSLIDLSLSTNNSLRSDIFESVISDHKPIWLELV